MKSKNILECISDYKNSTKQREQSSYASTPKDSMILPFLNYSADNHETHHRGKIPWLT